MQMAAPNRSRAHLDGPVEDLLDGTGRVLDPGLLGALPEVLRGYHDAQLRVVQVGQGLGQEVGPRREVGVEDDDELAARPGERVAQVAGLLVHPLARPPDVVQPDVRGQGLGLVGWPVIQDERLSRPGIGGQQPGHRGPGVVQHLDGLAADRQEDVHVGIAGRVPRRDPRLVRGEVEAAPGEVHRQAGHQVQHIRRGEHHERPHRRVVHLEPDLADRQAGRADDNGGGQVGQVPLQVGVLLGVIRWPGQDQPGAASRVRCERRPASPGSRSVARGGHCGALYRQMT